MRGRPMNPTPGSFGSLGAVTGMTGGAPHPLAAPIPTSPLAAMAPPPPPPSGAPGMATGTMGLPTPPAVSPGIVPRFGPMLR